MTSDRWSEASAVPAEIHRAHELLLTFGRLGYQVTQALRSRVGAGLTDNVHVLVIVTLAANGPQRPGNLIEQTGMTSGGVTKMLDRLERQGLLTREYGRVSGDRRGSLIELTPAGQQAAIDLAEGILSRMDAVRAAAHELRDLLEGLPD